MSVRIIPFRPEPPVDTATPLAVLQRGFLAVEEALAGPWSDSVLISLLATASPLERGAVLAELEQRVIDRRRPS